MRLLTSFLPLRNIEASDLNLRNPWKIARTQRKNSNDSMGIQYLKIPRGRKRVEQKPPMSGKLGVVIEIEDRSVMIIHAEQAEQAK